MLLRGPCQPGEDPRLAHTDPVSLPALFPFFELDHFGDGKLVLDLYQSDHSHRAIHPAEDLTGDRMLEGLPLSPRQMCISANCLTSDLIRRHWETRKFTGELAPKLAPLT